MRNSLTSALGRLSIDLPKITARSASTYTRYRKARPDLTHFEPGHGEQIWVWSNVFTHQVIYSHKPVMDSSRALRQLPFNGNLSKPVKLRKDYWAPMALIQFAKGSGVVGQSVFQKLREFRLEHELSWGWQKDDLTKLERRTKHKISPFAAALNNQKSNSIADMAAVLGGAGRGNRIWTVPEVQKGEAVEAGDGAKGTLTEVTVYWADIKDREDAEAWSSNVKMMEGLPPVTKGKDKSKFEPQAQSAFEDMAKQSVEEHAGA